MGLRVNTNPQSIAAQRHLGSTNMAQRNSLEKLASGTRIVRAADDAAGLAISENMRAQIRSVGQNLRNANDGISLIQTAEGGLNEVSNILVRFRELAIQSSTDTLTDSERGFIDLEVQQLKTEIGRIASSTEFNGRKLLDGQADSPLEIQIGQRNVPEFDRFGIDMKSFDSTVDRLGLSDFNVARKEDAQNGLEAIDSGLGIVSGNRATLGALQNRLQSSVNTLAIYDENLQTSRSRIYDVDVASETAELTKRNILSTAGVSVLGQANQNNLLALKLLS